MHKVTDRITIKNLGLKGRCQELVKYISRVPDFEEEQKKEKELEPIKPKEIKIIPLRRSDADWVARGIYSEYGFSYLNDIVYYPDRFYEAAQNGSIHSIVAVDEEGRFLGHAAAFKWDDIPGIYESGMAVVNPACRGAGVFNLIMTTLEAQIRAMPDAKQNLGDAVTTHTFSQKGGYNSGSRATGFIFCMTPPGSLQSTFRKKEEKTSMQRDSYVLTPSVIDYSEKTVYSVPEISDITDFAYGILDLKRSVITDDVPPEVDISVGDCSTSTIWHFSRIVISEIGRDIAERIKRDILEAKRNGSAMIQLCLSMDKPGVYQAYEAAKAQGFFCTGLLPVTGMGDVLLMTNLFENTVDYENIQVLEPYKPLLEMIKKLDPDRN